ncbi:hypothetical protein [uncultured Duncaniella sp.]|uniref:hypothetical protein n=1 Tax=uncultured Duncaniella sp. TaxID=2768039 RepID=UPI00263858C3|nr:hypothetical protein [uncultured Duncaniella sp.]
MGYNLSFHPDGIKPSFVDTIYDTLRNVPAWALHDRSIDKEMEALSSNILMQHKNKRTDGYKRGYVIHLYLKQPLFFCGDEPINYSPRIMQKYEIDPTAEGREWDKWVMVKQETGTHHVKYAIDYYGKVSPFLLVAQVLCDIYRDTRWKLVRNCWMQNHGRFEDAMQKSVETNMAWIDAMMNMVSYDTLNGTTIYMAPIIGENGYDATDPNDFMINLYIHKM